MSIIKNTILLLKSQKSDGATDKYEELLKAKNFEVIQVKTLDFIYKNIEILSEKIRNPSNYNGIIFSSPRCVNAVYQSLNGDNISNDWFEKCNFAVGETTYEQALNKFGLKCRGKEAGNAKNLSKIIIQEKDKLKAVDKPFLFPHGNLKTDTLSIELGKENLSMDNVLVYDTIPNPTVEEEFRIVTNKFTSLPEFVVFFSPSGLRSTINLIRKIPVDLTTIKFIAIGPVTELAMKEDNLNIYGVAQNPNAEDILKIVAK